MSIEKLNHSLVVSKDNLFIDIITPVVSPTQIAGDVMHVQYVIH